MKLRPSEGSETPFSADVYFLDDLKGAAEDNKIKIVNLKADIVGIDETITFYNPVTFNGEDHKLKFVNKGQNLVFLQPSKINNLTVEADGTDSWTSTYAVQVYNGKGYSIKDSTFSGGNAGLLVNSADATIENVNVSGNSFGGIEVAKGSAPEASQTSSLTVKGTITNTTEEYGKPTIWIDGASEELSVNAEGLFSTTEVKEGQVQYYISEEHSVQ